MVAALGGIEAVRVVHRAAALLLLATGLVHFLDVAHHVFVRGGSLSMWPRAQDWRDLRDTVRFNFGRSGEPPRLGRYTFEEKIEYWALLWGTAIMAVTGFMLWNPIATARVLSGQFIPAALAAHAGEALLAVLSVIVWHGYGVHVRHFNRSMFTGTMTAAEMRAHHPLELEALTLGGGPDAPDPQVLARRFRRFLPAAVLLALVVVFGLYRFVTFEQTAIATVPPPPP
jgi:thiosulfate reductase cytochrome b subunit